MKRKKTWTREHQREYRRNIYATILYNHDVAKQRQKLAERLAEKEAQEKANRELDEVVREVYKNVFGRYPEEEEDGYRGKTNEGRNR